MKLLSGSHIIANRKHKAIYSETNLNEKGLQNVN